MKLQEHLNIAIDFAIIRRAIADVRGDIDIMLTDEECNLLANCVLATRDLNGHMAELGVYKGGSAAIICKFKEDNHLFLFDTFIGLPKPTPVDTKYTEGQFAYTQSTVAKNLKGNKNVYIYKGDFAETIKNNTSFSTFKYSFAHFDGDIYSSCCDFISFFHNKMLLNGIMLLHNVGDSRGIKKCMKENHIFLENYGYSIMVAGNQCIIKKEK